MRLPGVTATKISGLSIASESTDLPCRLVSSGSLGFTLIIVALAGLTFISRPTQVNGLSRYDQPNLDQNLSQNAKRTPQNTVPHHPTISSTSQVAAPVTTVLTTSLGLTPSFQTYLPVVGLSWSGEVFSSLIPDDNSATISPVLTSTQVNSPVITGHNPLRPPLPVRPLSPWLIHEPLLPDWAKRILNDGPDVTKKLAIATSVETGISGNKTMYNGSSITYTIVVTSDGDEAISNILLLDSLPPGGFDDIQCTDGCVVTYTLIELKDREGDPAGIISVPRQITWTINTLPPGQSVVKTFNSTVTCQPDNKIFTNQAFVIAPGLGGSFAGVDTVVHSSVELDGNASLSVAPVWCSVERQGIEGMDWGDFDDVLFVNDGTMLASSPAWTSTQANESRSVAWHDFNNDNYPDFAIGRQNGPTQVYVNNKDNTFAYFANGTYTVSLTVRSEACPVAHEVITTRNVPIGTGKPDNLIYIPVIQR